MKSKAAFVAAGCAVVATLLVTLLRNDEPPSSASQEATSPQATQAPNTTDGKPATAAVTPATAATAKRLEATTESPPPATVERRTLTGRVVDERRLPFPGATIEVRKNYAIVETTSSDAAGRFTIAPAVADRDNGGVVVIARAGNDRVAMKPWGAKYYGHDLGTDLGTLVLARASPLRVLVTRDGAPVADAGVAVEVGKWRWPAFAARTDAAGRVTIDGVPDGYTVVRAEDASGSGRTRAFVPEQQDVEVALAPTPPFDVIVVEKGTQVPIAGAQLTVAEAFIVPSVPGGDDLWPMGDLHTSLPMPERAVATDAAGRARFANLDTGGRFTVSATATGFRPQMATLEHGQAPGPQRIEMARIAGRDVRVPVVAGEMPVPAEGAEVTVRFEARENSSETREPPGVLRMGRGEFVIPGWEGYGEFVARTQDGAIAMVRIMREDTIAKETAFARPRSIAVHAVDATGRPIAGARARARTESTYPICDDVVTDADGRAVLRDLPPRAMVLVKVASPVSKGDGIDAGRVDLTKGDGAVEVILPQAITVLLRTRIDGVPALPPSFRISAGFIQFPPVLEEFPERGEVRLAIDVAASDFGKPMKLHVSGSGELSGSAAFTPVQGGPEQVVSMDLTRGSRLDAVVSRAPTTAVAIAIEMRDPATGVFGKAIMSPISIPNGPGDTFRFGGLKEGVYRVTDKESKTSSPEVTVAAGTVATVAFAISARTMVTGTVLFPDGTDWTAIRVVAEVPGLAQGDSGVQVAQDGSFELQIPGDRDVVVRPSHPWLQPAAQGGRLTTKVGATGVTLQLVAGQNVRLPAPGVTAPRAPFKDPRVGIWRGAIAGPPERWVTAPLVDGELRFGGLEPGTYSFFVDVMSGFAPLELTNVVVATGTTTLPAATFTRGSSVRVRIIMAAGFKPQSIDVHATRVGAPEYARWAGSNGESEIVLRGLGPGDFRITANTMTSATKLLDRTITCDGTNDVTLDLDLR